MSAETTATASYASLTDLEKAVVDSILHAEYMDNGADTVCTWSFAFVEAAQAATGKSPRSIAGVMGSLARKGWIHTTGTGTEDDLVAVWFAPAMVARLHELEDAEQAAKAEAAAPRVQSGELSPKPFAGSRYVGLYDADDKWVVTVREDLLHAAIYAAEKEETFEVFAEFEAEQAEVSDGIETSPAAQAYAAGVAEREARMRHAEEQMRKAAAEKRRLQAQAKEHSLDISFRNGIGMPVNVYTCYAAGISVLPDDEGQCPECGVSLT